MVKVFWDSDFEFRVYISQLPSSRLQASDFLVVHPCGASLDAPLDVEERDDESVPGFGIPVLVFQFLVPSFG